jgi:hypothetical protein
MQRLSLRLALSLAFIRSVETPDNLNPASTRDFVEYSQAQGFVVDPGRIRPPAGQAYPDRNVSCAQERFWKASRLADARAQAKRWCLEMDAFKAPSHGSPWSPAVAGIPCAGTRTRGHRVR